VTETTITSVSRESRIFKPSAEFKGQANLGGFATYRRLYAESVNAPEKFWARQAKEHLVWRKPFKRVLQWESPHCKWFSGGYLNLAENCLDRHLGTHREHKAALVFEGEPGDVRTYTYRQLHREVCKFANVLQSLGLQKGDRAAIYLPMVPEAAVAMLACARVGVVHTVIFGGFSAEAIKDRVKFVDIHSGRRVGEAVKGDLGRVKICVCVPAGVGASWGIPYAAVFQPGRGRCCVGRAIAASTAHGPPIGAKTARIGAGQALAWARRLHAR
jgi:hypothetical protein